MSNQQEKNRWIQTPKCLLQFATTFNMIYRQRKNDDRLVIVVTCYDVSSRAGVIYFNNIYTKYYILVYIINILYTQVTAPLREIAAVQRHWRNGGMRSVCRTDDVACIRPISIKHNNIIVIIITTITIIIIYYYYNTGERDAFTSQYRYVVYYIILRCW